MNGLTARLALDELALRPGQTLAVTGAAGAVGGYVVQLGKAEGLRVVADAARLRRAAGAASSEPTRSWVVASTSPTRCARWFRTALTDWSTPPSLTSSPWGPFGIRAASPRCAGTTVRATEQRGIAFVPIFVRTYARERGKLDRLRALAEDGTLTLRVARTLPAEQAPEAHRVLEAGGTRGRLVLEL